MAKKITTRLSELGKRLAHYDDQYYNHDISEISDSKYDALRLEFTKLVEENPKEAESLKIEIGVGAMPTGPLEKVKHRNKLLSLDNAYTDADMSKFLLMASSALVKQGHTGHVDYVGELKIDGLSISCTYEDGVLSRSVTRGDGFTGEDVTLHVKEITGVPTRLIEGFPKTLEIRGEVFLPKSEFILINKRLENEGKAPFASCRNAASGILRRKADPHGDRKRLQVFFYTLAHSSDGLPDTQVEALEVMKALGLPTDTWWKYLPTRDAVMKYYHDAVALRGKLDYDIDGVVFKVNSMAYQTALGATGRFPKWAISWKFEAPIHETILEDITVQVGRTGNITPVAQIKPVIIDGVTVTKATLHNEDYIKELDLRIGDTVGVQRAGDVIPKITGVIKSSDGKRGKPFVFPTQCPSCKGEITRREGEASHKCLNADGCPGQQLERMATFVGRDGMNIVGLSHKTLSELIKAKLITTPVSILDLIKPEVSHKLLALPGWKMKSVDNLLHAIHKALECPMDRYLYCLQIDHVGRSVSRWIAELYPTPDLFLAEMEAACGPDGKSRLDRIANLSGVGDSVVDSLLAYFKIPGNLEKARDFASKIHVPAPEVIEESPLMGKRLVFTGGFIRAPRKDWEKLVKKHGGLVSGSVSKKTDYVVVGENPGSKAEDALTLNVTTLNEDELATLLGQ